MARARPPGYLTTAQTAPNERKRVVLVRALGDKLLSPIALHSYVAKVVFLVKLRNYVSSLCRLNSREDLDGIKITEPRKCADGM